MGPGEAGRTPGAGDGRVPERLRVLLVEDDALVARWVSLTLGQEGFDVAVAADGDRGYALGAAGGYDLAIVDVELPGRDGISVVRGIRAAGVVAPVLVMTGCGDDENIVRALDAGADDYVVKPVSGSVLRARIRAVLRRGGNAGAQRLEAGPLLLDRLAHQVSVAGHPLDLTPREFAILEQLLLQRGEVVTRPELLERVWGMTFDPGSGLIDTTMGRLRAKLAAAGGAGVIRTVRGEGFRIEAP